MDLTDRIGIAAGLEPDSWRLGLVSFELPAAKKVLVLAPHPDDEALGCGGAIRLYVENNTHVDVVILTDGSQLANATNALAAQRRQESKAAAKILEYGEPVFLNLPDGQLSKFATRAVRMLQSTEHPPDIVFAPSFLDIHPDHIATANIAAKLATKWENTRVAYYSVYQPIRPNCFVPIDSVRSYKEKAIDSYRSSLADSTEYCRQSVIRSNGSWIFQTVRPGLHEPFLVTQASTTKKQIVAWISCKAGKKQL